MRTAISIKGLRQQFKEKGKTRIIYESLSMDIPEGELFIILGRNGVGKSTLLRCISGLQKIQDGRIDIFGKNLQSIGKKELAHLISYVSTDMMRINNLSVRTMVGMGRSPYTNWIGRLSKEDEDIIEHSLNMVGMSTFSKKDVTTLSDGERQRVMIARALAQDTEIILLDEPTAFLDIPYKYEIASLLRTLSHEYNKTIVFTTHDLNIAIRLGDTVCIMDKSGVSYGSPEDNIINGSINSMLRNSPLIYDTQNSEIKLNPKIKGEIKLICDTEIRKLMVNALERTGFTVTDKAINMVSVNGENITIVSGIGETKFHNIGDMLRYLRTNILM